MQSQKAPFLQAEPPGQHGVKAVKNGVLSSVSELLGVEQRPDSAPCVLGQAKLWFSGEKPGLTVFSLLRGRQEQEGQRPRRRGRGL